MYLSGILFFGMSIFCSPTLAAYADSLRAISMQTNIAVATVLSGVQAQLGKIDAQLESGNSFDDAMKAIDTFHPKHGIDNDIEFNRWVRQTSYNSLVNAEGLIIKWTGIDALKQHTFCTKLGTTDGDSIREAINRAALGHHIAVRNSNTKNIVSSEIAVDLLVSADQHLGDHRFDAFARRSMEQAKVITDYMLNHERTYHYDDTHVDWSAAAALRVPRVAGGPLGTQVVFAIDEFARLEEHQKTDLVKFHTQIALENVKQYNIKGDLLGAHKMIGNAFAVIDFAKGASQGLVQNVYDVATGMWHLVSHPIDSAEAITNAIRHYDLVYDLATRHLQNLVNNYPNMSVEERGKIIGYVAGEILTWMATGGFSISKEISAVAKISRAVAIEVEKAVPVARALGAGAIDVGRASAKLPDHIMQWVAQNGWKPPDEAILKIPEFLGEPKLNRDGKGLRWLDSEKAKYAIRIDRGNPTMEFATQQVDHVAIVYNGRIIGRDGRWIQPTKTIPSPKNAPEAHIPLSEWITWKHWWQP